MPVLNFPKKVQIFNADHQIETFGPGDVSVSDELATHWYFVTSGVKLRNEDGELVSLVPEEESEEQEETPTPRKRTKKNQE